ncbi:hypothetical protein GCM10007304_43920 [Rhodococcoides trifolii]|uniref:Uncharacterized protein n=1 Tax=Rhodococcoides trifolii TaxID=908250 RepID=A0A917G777_9NOCA|nr:hypothetical protein [Rhodococcus trifolii]GGG25290.1 hypothetical protein GCM10007304_43920 [Rhodococcus trifolii]
MTVRPRTPEQSNNTPALDRLVRIMFVNAAIGLVAAVCTWIFHDLILAHQLAGQDPTSPDYATLRDTLSTTLWSRPGPAATIALLFPLFVRRLRSLRRRSYRRVLIIAVLQLVSVGWLTVGADYPLWLRTLYLVQAAAVVATLIAATRPRVRTLFGYQRPARTGNRTAALFLAVATPSIAEVAFGSTPITLSWLIVLWIPVYGGGVVLIRELVVRTGRGWPSVILLAVGYEVVEDGIGLQALTSPHLYDAADWGVRVLGVNVTYWEANAIYHAIFTVVVPIVLTTLVFPRHVHRPYLGERGTAATAVVAVAGVVLLRFTVPPSQDPGYQTPIPFVVGCVIGVALLGLVALRVLPPRTVHRTQRFPVPLPWLYAASFSASVSVLWLTFRSFGSSQPAFTHGAEALVPMVMALVVLSISVAALRYCAASTAWTRRHTLAVVGGALIGHTVAGIGIWSGDTERVALAVIAVVTAVLVYRGDRTMDAPSRSTTRTQPVGQTSQS